MSTQRPNCVSQLKYQDIKQEADGLHMTFRRGKSVKLRRKVYSLKTAAGPLQRYLSLNGEPNHFLFYAKEPEDRADLLKTMTRLLREVNPDLESRSIRRGALQAMARCGVDQDVMMHFSGHTNLAMLNRYLDFGILLAKQVERQHQAAKAALGVDETRSNPAC